MTVGPYWAVLGGFWGGLGRSRAEKREYGTEGSQVITDLSTNRACSCLTSQIGRDMVFSTKYGRTQRLTTLLYSNIGQNDELPRDDAVERGSITFRFPDHKVN